MFPDGMKVLAVDGDVDCLGSLVTLLEQCNYKVDAEGNASEALKIVRDDPQNFDIVIIAAEMPDMDGFTLLDAIVSETDLPVIITSVNSEDRNMVLKGIKHKACCHLFKPLRLLEMKGIWQYVVKKKLFDSSRPGGMPEEKNALEEIKQEVHPQEPSLEDGHAVQKKQRVSWTVELHLKFLNALRVLGSADKAVPSKVLEVMDEPGLSRDQVASHLQKYRIMLRKECPKSGRQEAGDTSSSCGPRRRGRPSKATTLIQSYNNNNNNNNNNNSAHPYSRHGLNTGTQAAGGTPDKPSSSSLEYAMENQNMLFQQYQPQPPQMGGVAGSSSAPIWDGGSQTRPLPAMFSGHSQNSLTGFPAQQFPDAPTILMGGTVNPNFFLEQDDHQGSSDNFSGIQIQNTLSRPLNVQVPNMENGQMLMRNFNPFK